jgi:hypothetical protein
MTVLVRGAVNINATFLKLLTFHGAICGAAFFRVLYMGSTYCEVE